MISVLRQQILGVDVLRWVLLLGLVFHKAVWEALARTSRPQQQITPPKAPAQAPSPLKRLVKLGKMGFLAFLVLQALFGRVFPISSEPTALQPIGLVIHLLGLTTAVAGRAALGRNWANLEDYQVLSRQAVVSTGIYRFIRHPIYTGDALLLVGLQLALNSWLVLAMLVPIAVFVRQALAEEALLTKSLTGYEAYRQRTKRFIPYVV